MLLHIALRTFALILTPALTAALALAGLSPKLALAQTKPANRASSLSAAAAASPTMQKIASSGRIVIAHAERSVPFSYVDANKRPMGYTVDICTRVIETIKKNYNLPDLKVDTMIVAGAERLNAIVEGRADLECGTTTNTAARRERVAFSITIYFAGGRMIVRTGSTVRELSDLRGQKVAVSKGSTHAKNLFERVKNGLVFAEVVETPSAPDAFALVEQGTAEAFLNDDVLLYAQKAQSKNPTGFQIVGTFQSMEPLAIILRKDDPNFKKIVDAAISHMMLDGKINAIYRRWFQSPVPPNGVTLDVPMSPLLRDQLRFPSDKVGDSVNG